MLPNQSHQGSTSSYASTSSYHSHENDSPARRFPWGVSRRRDRHVDDEESTFIPYTPASQNERYPLQEFTPGDGYQQSDDGVGYVENSPTSAWSISSIFTLPEYTSIADAPRGTLPVPVLPPEMRRKAAEFWNILGHHATQTFDPNTPQYQIFAASLALMAANFTMSGGQIADTPLVKGVAGYLQALPVALATAYPLVWSYCKGEPLDNLKTHAFAAVTGLAGAIATGWGESHSLGSYQGAGTIASTVSGNALLVTGVLGLRNQLGAAGAQYETLTNQYNALYESSEQTLYDLRTTVTYANALDEACTNLAQELTLAGTQGLRLTTGQTAPDPLGINTNLAPGASLLHRYGPASHTDSQGSTPQLFDSPNSATNPSTGNSQHFTPSGSPALAITGPPQNPGSMAAPQRLPLGSSSLPQMGYTPAPAQWAQNQNPRRSI